MRFQILKRKFSERASDDVLMHLCAYLALLICAAFMFVIGCRAIPLGVVGEWVLERKLVPAMRLMPIGFATALFIFALWRCAAFPPRSAKGIILAYMLILALAILIRFAAQAVEPYGRHPMAFATYTAISPIATSYFMAAKDAERSGWLNVLRDYDEFMRRQPVHATTHPPGMLLLYSLIRGMAYHSSWLQRLAYKFLGGEGMAAFHILTVQRLLGVSVERWELAAAFASSQIMLLLGAFALPFIMMGVASLIKRPLDEQNGASFQSCATSQGLWLAIAVAASLYSLSAGQLAYIASPDQVLVLISAIGTACICVWAVEPMQRKFMLSLCGIFGFAGVVCSFKFLPIVATWLVWTFWAAYRSQARGIAVGILEALKAFIWLAVPMVVSALLFAVAFHFDWLGAFVSALHAHSQQAASSVRTYWKWAIVNLIEFGISLGPGMVALLKLCYLRSTIRSCSLEFAGALSSLATLFVIDALGFVRGEVSRIWLPFVPPIVVGVAADISRWNLNRWQMPLVMLFLSQALLGLFAKAMVDAVRPW